jgi:hypothetical protein
MLPRRRQTVLWAALLSVAFSIAAGAEKPKKLTDAQLQRLYMDYLVEEGYRPSVDEDGDVKFKREGYTLYIGVDPEDAGFFRVFLPNIWEIESDEERVRVLFAIDHANRDTKVTKVYLTTDSLDVWISTELFVAKPEDFEGVFKRAVEAIDHARQEFVDKMNEKRAAVPNTA